MQHVDRGRRALRHGRAGRDDLRLSQGPAVRAEGRGVRSRGRGMARADDRPRTRSSTGRSRSTPNDIAPIVTWGTSPEDALPIDASVPDPAREPDEARAQLSARRARLHGDRAGPASSPTSRSIACSSAPAPIPASRICARRRRCCRAAQQGAGPGVGRLVAGQAPGRAGGARPHLPRRGPRMGRVRLLDVRRHQRRSRRAGRALRLDHQPQFPRPAGARRAHAPDVAGDGRGGGGQRPSRRCAAAARGRKV